MEIPQIFACLLINMLVFAYCYDSLIGSFFKESLQFLTDIIIPCLPLLYFLSTGIELDLLLGSQSSTGNT